MVDISEFSFFQQGSESKIYTGSYLNRNALAKIRFSKAYRHPVLDSKLIKERTKAEVRSILRCKNAGIATPTIYLADIESATIVMEYLEAVRVRDYIDKLFKEKRTEDLEKLIKSIGVILGNMHQNDIIHGDLTTSNILVQEMKDSDKIKLYLIDFGLGSVEGSAEDKGVDIYVLERALISTHPKTEPLFEKLIESYQEQILKPKKRDEIIKKYKEIRLRGRKRCMEG